MQLHGQIVWRFPIAFQIVFVLITLATLPFLPESPRFLYFKDRIEEGNAVLAALKGEPVASPIVQAEAREILAAIEMENALGQGSIKDILLNRSGDRILRRLVLVFVIQMLQEMTGVSSRCFDPNDLLTWYRHKLSSTTARQYSSHWVSRTSWLSFWAESSRLRFSWDPSSASSLSIGSVARSF
jgi:hypothetical protein